MHMARYLLVSLFFLSLHAVCSAQNDTIPAYIKGQQPPSIRSADTNLLHRTQPKDKPYKTDSATRAAHSPRKATLYSTFFPGLGQIYNRKYWKAPIVWAAVGIPAYTYFYNKNWYKKTQFAISVLDTYSALGLAVPADSLKLVDPKLQPLVTASDDIDLRNYRNEFRKDQDYSLLFFLLFWGLNVVDATVDAHLMGFDISNQLSLRVEQPSDRVTLPGPMGAGMGLSLVLDFHKARYRSLPMP